MTEDRLFVTGASGGRLAVVALDRTGGDLLWQRSFVGDDGADFGHVDASPAMPSPCTDGSRVYAYFGGYGLVALDLEGQLVWERRMVNPRMDFGVGTSPILAGGKLFLQRDGAKEGAILALDPATGEELFRIERFGFGGSYSTPFLWRNREREELVVPGTMQLWSYDPASGEPLWNVRDITLFTCTTPSGDAERLVFAGWSSPNASPRDLLASGFAPPFKISEEEFETPRRLFDRIDANGDGTLQRDEMPEGRARDAFQGLDGNGNGTWEFDEFNFLAGGSPPPGKNVALSVRAGGEGDVTESHVEWTWTRGIPYVASPLLYRDRVWMAKAGGLITTLDAASGERKIDRERLPAAGEYYMSPVAVGDHVLVGAISGELYVLPASDEFGVVNTLEFGEPLAATPAVTGGRMYVRTESTVWAF